MIIIPSVTLILIFIILIFLSKILVFIALFLAVFKKRYAGFWSYTKLHPYKFYSFAAAVILLNVYGYYMGRDFERIEKEVYRLHDVRVSRRNFSLTEDYQYGDVLFPTGTKVVRWDPYDTGEEELVNLYGLTRADFPHPIQIANLSVSAIQLQGIRWLLYPAEKQKISDEWCDKNQVAQFEYPYQKHERVILFKPSEWTFKGCISASEVTSKNPTTES